MKRILIMAEGAGTRWSHATQTRYREKLGWIDVSMHKQLLPIGDEPMILRTIRMVRELDPAELVIVAHADLGHHVAALGEVYTQGYICSLVEGIRNTRSYWVEDGSTIFLLGDVVFSYVSLEKLLGYKGQAALLGRLGANEITGKEASEIFAMTIGPSVYESVYEACEWLRKSEATAKRSMKLWDLFGYLVEPRGWPPEVAFDFLTIPSDYTDDVDSPEEYLQFFTKLEESALNDARQPQESPGGAK